MEKKRSIEDMMKLYGTKWGYLSTKRTFIQFMLDADAAGFRFGGMSCTIAISLQCMTTGLWLM